MLRNRKEYGCGDEKGNNDEWKDIEIDDESDKTIKDKNVPSRTLPKNTNTRALIFTPIDTTIPTTVVVDSGRVASSTAAVAAVVATRAFATVAVAAIVNEKKTYHWRQS